MNLRKTFFLVARLINSVVEVAPDKSFNTEVYELEKVDLKVLTKTRGWLFNWRAEYKASGRKCYKLLLENSNEIQGMISIEDEQTHLRLHLIETAPTNLGKHKKYKGVLQSLSAFACKRSIEFGYDGVVIFMAKTRLIKHYEKELEAVHIGGGQMVIYEEEAQKLVS